MEDKQYFNINRLKVINIDKIPENCPKFIIIFIAKSLGIKINFIDSDEWWSINEQKIISFIESEHKLVTKSYNLRDIALFVNPIDDIEWKDKKILLKSYYHIHAFNPNLPIKNITIGNKTDKFPYNIDPCMIYQICLKYNISINRETTYEDIYQEILLINRNLYDIRNDIINKIFKLNRNDLIILNNKLTNSLICNNKYNRLDIINHVKYTYMVDISYSMYPEEENKLLETHPIEEYIPFDILFREKYLKNPYYFRYNKRYIHDFDYKNEGLKQILHFYNGNDDISDILVLGIHPDCNEEYTCILKDKIDEDQDIRREKYISTKDYIISVDELYDYWNELYILNSPCKPYIEFSNKHLSKIIRNGNSKLKDLIYNIQYNRKDRIDRGYSILLNDLTISKSLLYNIIEIGFILRGYKVCYDIYPLEESSYDLKYQDEIEIKSSLEINKYLENTLYTNINCKVPILTCKNILGDTDNVCEIRTLDKESNLKTILVKILNDTDNIDSCMRTNSNYLLITGWYYMYRVYEISPFDIKKLNFVL